ncbi:MAG: C4-dicarboxylic acid transporter DauA [Succinivibrionaceae bacterium]|nr:C4-dicarboxylic acid transporter DauA [Succinivibrionaceae bacterium]
MYDSCVLNRYTSQRFVSDLLAGLTVGIIAIPLAMALAINSGVDPQYGLYTAIVAGICIALTGGSRFSVSGPTAAFVVILFPIAQQYGVGGLLTASIMAGMFLLFFAAMRLGRLLIYIPIEVTQGFTLGIGILIGVLQIKDFFGLTIDSMPAEFHNKLAVLAHSLPNLNQHDTIVGMVSLITVFGWPKLKRIFKGSLSKIFTCVPSHLPAVILGMLAAWIICHYTGNDDAVQTIGSRFTYLNEDGTAGHGIPPILPHFSLPWNLPGPDGQPINWNIETIQNLMFASFSMAVLGAIESLLCAVILDGMTGTKHHSNSELLGQGIGNIVAPFFGGITATAAIARSAANVRAGATSPVAAIVHSLVVLLSILCLAPFLSMLPLASMAALLLMVAYNMSDIKGIAKTVRTVPLSDVFILVICVALTVFFDMVIAIAFGCIMATIFFMRSMAKMTTCRDLVETGKLHADKVPEGWLAYKINGPLFFAAADKVFNDIIVNCNGKRGLIIDFTAVNIIDAGGLSSLLHFQADLQRANVTLLMCDLQYQPLKTLVHAKFQPVEGKSEICPNIEEALIKAAGIGTIQEKTQAADPAV